MEGDFTDGKTHLTDEGEILTQVFFSFPTSYGRSQRRSAHRMLLFTHALLHRENQKNEGNSAVFCAIMLSWRGGTGSWLLFSNEELNLLNIIGLHEG